VSREAEPLVLLAEDDEDDAFLLQEALKNDGWRGRLDRVRDGEELLEVLRAGTRPDLILLDLDMPRKDGRQALAEIKRDEELRVIPVIVLTTSAAEVDVLGAYRAGANSYMVKCSECETLTRLLRVLGSYWFEACVLPPLR